MREDLAILSISGWMDGAYMNGAISRYLSAPCREKRLLIGPWDHGARVNASPFRDRESPEFPLLAEILRFFDTHVRGIDTGLADEAPVHFHTMRAERWESARGWPVERDRRTLFLGRGGMLGAAEPEPGGIDHLADFRLGTGLHTRYGRLQIRPVQEYYPDWEERSRDHLAFRSEPLAEETTLAGHPILALDFACDQPDACVFAYLEDIAPDGRRRYVTEGMLRALHRGGSEASDSYRASWPLPSFRRADAAPLTPGEPVRLVVPLLPTAWSFTAGHRIGLRLAGADRDNFALWPYGRPGGWRIGTGGTDAPGGSTLTLPVL
jgi:putative CocE/NonD family hydrolase